jgi:glycosyltransferase involved in cell wall biosynthesis
MSHEPIRPEDGRGSAEPDKAMTATSRHLPRNSASPLVSICIPTFNAARWIQVCLESALAQTYPSLEILIVDDGSTDETVELVRSIDDERIRLMVNEQNVGLAQNWNRCIEMSRADFIKLLFHDDLLYPDCVEKMMQLLLSHEHVGLVFSPRDVIVEEDPEGKSTKKWLQNWTTLHTRFRALEAVNRGRDLFTQYLSSGFQGNWIGEPSSVLIRKGCFTRLGLFNPKLYQVCDVEMWLRIMFFYDIGFLPEKLSAFRFHSDSTSSRNMISRRNFLDQLWLLESLSNCKPIMSAHPEIERIRALELARLAKALLLHPVAIGRWLGTDQLAREGMQYLPKWTKSAAAYAARKLFRLGNPAR